MEIRNKKITDANPDTGLNRKVYLIWTGSQWKLPENPTAMSYFSLGIVYKYSIGSLHKMDSKQSSELFLYSANLGLAEGMYMYANTIPIKEFPLKMNWLRRAAENTIMMAVPNGYYLNPLIGDTESSKSWKIWGFPTKNLIAF